MKNTLRTTGILLVAIITLISLCSCNENAPVPKDEAKLTAYPVALTVEEPKTIAPEKEQTEYYRVRMVHVTGQVYDTGYFSREDMMHGELYINPNGDHRILTGKYGVEVSGYVTKTLVSEDMMESEYVMVAKDVMEVSVNTDTKFLVFQLKTINHEVMDYFEFEAVLPELFCESAVFETTDGLSPTGYYTRFSGVATAIDGRDLIIPLSGRVVGMVENNIVRVRMEARSNEDGAAMLTGGLYKLEVTASLNLNAEEMVDSRNGVSVLRLIPGMETLGRIDMSYGPEASGSIHIDIDDLSSIVVKDFETFDGVVTKFQGNPNSDGDWTVTFPTYDVEKAMGSWYVNGEEIDSGIISKSVRDDHTTFTIPETVFSSGSNVISCLFIHESGRIGDYTVNVKYHPYTGEEPAL